MEVARINFLLGAQNLVVCLKRHEATIQIPKIAVAVPALA